MLYRYFRGVVALKHKTPLSVFFRKIGKKPQRIHLHFLKNH